MGFILTDYAVFRLRVEYFCILRRGPSLEPNKTTPPCGVDFCWREAKGQMQ